MKKVIKDLAQKTAKELAKDVANAQQEVHKLQVEFKISGQKDVNMIAKKKRQVAQLLTVLHEKNLEVK